MYLIKIEGTYTQTLFFWFLTMFTFYKLFAVAQDSSPNLCLKPLPKFILS